MNRTIGVIANPASGKDIRRLVSYATTIDNNEKVNICKRIVLAAQGLGVESVVFMPETFMLMQYMLLERLTGTFPEYPLRNKLPGVLLYSRILRSTY